MNFLKSIFDGVSNFFRPSTISVRDKQYSSNQSHYQPKISDDFLREVNNEARNRRLESAIVQKNFGSAG